MPKEDPIIKLIKEKKVLALGCKFDNWYFRFFWYILRRDFNRFREGQVAFMLDENNQVERNLSNFLKHSKIYRHNNARLFMSEVTQWLNAMPEGDGIVSQLIRKNRQKGGVFLCYCSKDVLIASQLFFMLCKQGYNVWFDNSALFGGDDYNRIIEKAIAESKVFIPLLTPHIANDLDKMQTNHYYNKEWKLACQLNNKCILPLAVNGYDLKKNYHTDGFLNFIGQTLSGIDLMEDGGLDKLFSTIDEKLR